MYLLRFAAAVALIGITGTCLDPLTTDDGFPLTIADNGKTVSFNPNALFSITLRECVGCAEIWEIDSIDTTKISYLGKKYSNRGCTNCPGGSQDVTFRFKTISMGTSNIVLAYFSDTMRVTVLSYGLD